MRKIFLFLLTLLAMWSCKNEEDGFDKAILSESATAFVRLSDNATRSAGTIKIVADVPEAELTWITIPECNLDTTQTTVYLKNGVGTLPVQWLNKQENGSYAPKNLAFKAWVRVKAGDEITDIPLILSERVDSVKLMQSIKTRAAGVLPRVASLEFIPPVVNMQATTGGRTELRVADMTSIIDVDYTGITDEMRIDKTNLPTTVSQTETLDFTWIGGTAPTTAFSVILTARSIADDLWASCTLNYDPNSGGDNPDLRYVSDNMPTGNLPATSKIYTFTFEGTYVGSVQLRTLSNGTVLYTATAYQYPANQPRARVPENTGAARPIQFEYKAGTGAWTAIPEANRTQDGTGVTPPEPGVTPSYSPITPEGDIPEGGGTYSSVFFNYVGTVYFRAVSGQGKLLDETSGTIATSGAVQLSLIIPASTSASDNQVIFQYSIDGNTWLPMETRTRLVGTFISNGIRDLPRMIPTSGGTYTYTSQGQLSGTLTIICKDAQNVVLSESRGTVGSAINVNVPANTTGKTRSVFFYFKRPDKPMYEYYMTYTQQNGF